MKLTVVGCSGSVSGPRSPASCYLVQAQPHDADGGVDEFTLVLDLGPGALGALYNYLPPSRIGAVGLSHLHADHCLDLCGLYVATTYAPDRTDAAIPVYGPAGTAERIARAYEAPPPSRPDVTVEQTRLEERFDYREWAGEQAIGPFSVRTALVAHPTPAYAIRVTEDATGATLVYSGDTGPDSALTELATGADLLLVEAAFLDRPDNPPNMHLSGSQAARIATNAGVANLVLTHIPPWHDPEEVSDEARPHFAGPLELASSGAQWTIEPGGARRLL